MTLKTIFLVDDDFVYQFLTKKIIVEARTDVNIETFSNGQDAIEYLKSEYKIPAKLPEVIFLDLAMPIMDGWQFLKEYGTLNGKFGKQILVYIVSSSITPSEINRAKEFDFVQDYIIKPITKQKFKDFIQNLTDLG